MPVDFLGRDMHDTYHIKQNSRYTASDVLQQSSSSKVFGRACKSCHFNFTGLHAAAWNGDLMQTGALANNEILLEVRCSKLGFTPLLCAAHQGHAEAAEALIRAGADVRVRCNQGWGVLHHCIARYVQYYHFDATERLAALLSLLSELGGLDLQQSPTPLDLLLLLPLSYHPQGGSTHPYRPWDYLPELASLLIQAGCLADAPLPSPCSGTLVEEWLQQVVAGEGGGWPLRLSHPPLLATASVLLHAAASSARSACYQASRACTRSVSQVLCGPAEAQPAHATAGDGERDSSRVGVQGAAFLAAAVRSGSLELVKVVLRAFPEACLWLKQESRSPLGLALEFLRPLPPQESWIGQYLRKVVHWCQLSDVLLEAGCQPLELKLQGQPPPPCLVPAPSASLDLPPWASKHLSFLPLQASGLPWTPATHLSFPAPFRLAARTLLLALQRQAALGQLPRLPVELQVQVVLLASRPLPHWSSALRYYLQAVRDD